MKLRARWVYSVQFELIVSSTKETDSVSTSTFSIVCVPIILQWKRQLTILFVQSAFVSWVLLLAWFKKKYMIYSVPLYVVYKVLKVKKKYHWNGKWVRARLNLKNEIRFIKRSFLKMFTNVHNIQTSFLWV